VPVNSVDGKILLIKVAQLEDKNLNELVDKKCEYKVDARKEYGARREKDVFVARSRAVAKEKEPCAVHAARNGRKRAGCSATKG